MITQSVSIILPAPSLTTGFLLPLLSGSPSVIPTTSIPVTKSLSSTIIFMGLVKNSNLTPSSFAWKTSSFLAGNSSSPRRYTTVTSAPNLSAVRAASIATFPPPTTTTLFALKTGVSEFSSKARIRLLLVKNSLAEKTPFAVSPSIPINFGKPAPLPIKTAEKPSFSNKSSIVTDFPIITFFSKQTPRRFSFSISLKTTFSLGRRNSGIP